jgi:hypothetical protein
MLQGSHWLVAAPQLQLLGYMFVVLEAAAAGVKLGSFFKNCNLPDQSF